MIKNYSVRKLSKTGSHRRCMFRNMITGLILNEKIITTNPKAKELRRFFDKVLNSAKENDYRSLREWVNNKQAFDKITKVLAERFKNKTSGYTTLINVGYRKGDNSLLTMVKLTD